MERFKKAFLICLMSMVTLLCFSLDSSALCADADGDNALTAGDARIVLRISVGLEKATADVVQNCDMDYDGKLTAGDAREILRLSVGYGRSDDSGADGFQGATPVGITDKYYKIYNINGFTYIDGLLIANKTYALPADYAPGINDEARTAFYEMQDAAAADGYDIFVMSAFRDYELQTKLYNNYVARDGKEAADLYSARPGHSEHQTGLAYDVNSLEYSFGDTAEGIWLAENCHLYGFIIRYPQGKEEITGYNYEPWHIRYLGVETATAVYESGLTLEEYLGITSEYAEE